MKLQTWNDLVRFKRRLKGHGGKVTIPTDDFLMLMEAAGKWMDEHPEDEQKEQVAE